MEQTHICSEPFETPSTFSSDLAAAIHKSFSLGASNIS